MANQSPVWLGRCGAFRCRFRRVTCALGAVAGSGLVIAVLAARGVAAVPVLPGPVPARSPQGEAIAGSAGRGFWFDGAEVRRLPGAGVVGQLPAGATGWPYVARSSRGGFALLAGGELFSAAPQALPRRVPSARFGCWTAGARASSALVTVARHELISAAAWSCAPRTPSGEQPVFARKLAGGRWHVLTRVSGRWPLMLAADQDTVAIGVQKSRSRMRVRLISTTGRAIAAPVLLPDGYLALDGRRLLVSTPTVGAFPLEPRYDVGFGFVQYGGVETSPVDTNGVYRVSEYSVRGRLVRRFGTSATQPLVSHRAMIVSAIAADGNETMTLRSLITGVSRPLIGFSDPGRELMTATFTWPALTLVDTTSAALPDGQFTCTNGTFSAPTPPTLVELNVIHTPFMPAPATPPQPTPAQRLAQCGPPPP